MVASVLLANVALFVIGLAVTLRSGADVSGAGSLVY